MRHILNVDKFVHYDGTTMDYGARAHISPELLIRHGVSEDIIQACTVVDQVETPTLVGWLLKMLYEWGKEHKGSWTVDATLKYNRILQRLIEWADRPGAAVPLDDDHYEWLRQELFGGAKPFGFNVFGPIVGFAVREALEAPEPAPVTAG